MTLCVDKTRCIGCGMCAAAVPEVFRVVEHVSTVLALPEPGRAGSSGCWTPPTAVR